MKWTFVCEVHDEGGWKGWREKRHPNFDPLAGMAVAHDVLEHFRGGDDGPAGELQAHGAIMWIRGMNNQFYGFNRPEQVIVTEFPEIFRHWYHEKMPLPEPPRRNLPSDHYEREFLLEAMHQGKRLLLSEFVEHGGGDAQEQQRYREAIDQFIPMAKGWMIDGLQKAKRRYRNTDSYSVAMMFRRIEAEADNALKYAEEGDHLEVTVVGNRDTVKLKRRDYNDY
jgi:hypothetical protein